MHGNRDSLLILLCRSFMICLSRLLDVHWWYPRTDILVKLIRLPQLTSQTNSTARSCPPASFADVINLRWGHTELRWVLIQLFMSLYKEQNLNTSICTERNAMWRRRQRLEGSVCKPKNAKDCSLSLKERKKAWKDPPLPH